MSKVFIPSCMCIVYVACRNIAKYEKNCLDSNLYKSMWYSDSYLEEQFFLEEIYVHLVKILFLIWK